MRSRKKKAKRRPLRVGDRVAFRYSFVDVKAVVIEDRGGLGYRGRQIVRVRFVFDRSSNTIIETELPAEEVKIVRRAA